MRLFSVLGLVVGTGKIQHMIRANLPGDAWQKFCRAHAKNECVMIDVKKAWGSK